MQIGNDFDAGGDWQVHKLWKNYAFYWTKIFLGKIKIHCRKLIEYFLSVFIGFLWKKKVIVIWSLINWERFPGFAQGRPNDRWHKEIGTIPILIDLNELFYWIFFSLLFLILFVKIQIITHSINRLSLNLKITQHKQQQSKQNLCGIK